MVYFARALISGRQKIALVLLLLGIIGFFAFYPRITEALLAFLLGGEVPGTHVILSPDVVLGIVAGVLIIGFVTLSLRLYFRLGRGSRNFIQVPIQSMTEVVPVDVTATGKKIEVRVESENALSRRTRLAKSWAILVGRVAYAAYRIWLVARNVSQAVYAAGRIAGNVLLTLLGLVSLACGAAAKALLSGLLWTARKLGRGTVISWQASWHWAKPRLERFDAWLEVRARKLEAYAKKQLNSHESVRSLSAISHEYRKSITDLHPKSVVRAAHQKIRQVKAVVTTPEQR